MVEGVARKVRKLLLFVTGWMTVAAAIVAGQANVAKSSTGSQAASTGDKAPAYDVVSIKPSKVWHRPRISPDSLSVSVTPLTLIYDAYGPMLPGQISGEPAWSTSAQFDIEAKMDEDTAAALQKLPAKQQAAQRQLMLQALLADRFNLRVHHETKTLPLYELVVAKGGSKLKESHATETNTNGIGRLTAKGMPIADLARLLTLIVNRFVVDKTGLTGQYDFELRWTPNDWSPLMEEFSWLLPEAVTGPSIFTAVQEQLGLKLVPSKGPVDVLVIDHIEQPSEN
jgi:uncharacterized protein (TIGR03435 family)